METFEKIRTETESIAAISEQHSATTQDILSTIETQDTGIKNIINLMEQVQNESYNLSNITQQ